MTEKIECTCDCEDSWKGAMCKYKNGCKYKRDSEYAIKNFDQIFKDIPHNRSAETGSRYICIPPVTDTDEDWVLDCSKPGQMEEAHDALKKHGFFVHSIQEDEYDDIREHFTAYRLGHLNLILCRSESFYKKFVFATELAAEMNLKEKKDRILLFQGILYGKINGEEY